MDNQKRFKPSSKEHDLDYEKPCIGTWTTDKKIIESTFGTGPTSVISTGLIAAKDYIEDDEYIKPPTSDTGTSNAANSENMSDNDMETKTENSQQNK